MDFVKKAASQLGGNNSQQPNNNNNAGPAEGGAAPQNNAGQEDYLDKGVDALGKKFGVNANREQSEKATDFLRGKFESASGQKVPEKFSN